jgi:hypothetical protein
MLELTVLIISIIAILVVLYLKDNSKTIETQEPFQDYYLNACPAGYKTFYNNDGNIICCDGEVVANKCLGDNRCTLNGKGTADMPNCVQAILKMYAEKSKTQCPTSIPSYYEDRGKNIKGCTNGRLNATLSGPQMSNQPTCKIYPTWELNRTSKDSCHNRKLLDNAKCFGNNCTKDLVQFMKNAPPLISIGFTDSTGIYRASYTRKSIEAYLDVANPKWRENTGLDLSKNLIVSEVAKAYFIDKTMDKSQIEF